MNAALSGPNGRIELGNTVLKIGRFSDNQLVMTDAKASSYHAEIHSDAHGYSILDLGSTNGTFVNEQRLIPHSPRSLSAGDSIRIGDSIYLYEAEDDSFYAPTLYAGAGPVLPDQAVYPPAVAASGFSPAPQLAQPIQQEYPEYQALSPIYAPPPPQNQVPPSPFSSSPPAQGSLSPDSNFIPQQLPDIQTPAVAPQKKGRKRLWITLAAVVVVLLLAAGALVYVNLPTPAKALDAFCSNVRSKHGDAAFDLFSDAIKNQASTLGRQVFVAAVNKGQIVGCTHSSPTTSNDNADAQLILTAVDGSTQTDNVHLVPDSGGAWKISNLQGA